MLNNYYFRGYLTLRTMFLIIYYLKQHEQLTFAQLFNLVKYNNKQVVYEILKILENMGDIRISKENKKTVITMTEKGKSFFDMHSDFLINYVQLINA